MADNRVRAWHVQWDRIPVTGRSRWFLYNDRGLRNAIVAFINRRIASTGRWPGVEEMAQVVWQWSDAHVDVNRNWVMNSNRNRF